MPWIIQGKVMMAWKSPYLRIFHLALKMNLAADDIRVEAMYAGSGISTAPDRKSVRTRVARQEMGQRTHDQTESWAENTRPDRKPGRSHNQTESQRCTCVTGTQRSHGQTGSQIEMF